MIDERRQSGGAEGPKTRAKPLQHVERHGRGTSVGRLLE
jgi:hypothetical protein